MKIRPLSIDGAWEFTPVQHGDARGLFAEVFKGDLLDDVIGHRLDLAQVNLSVSAAGVLRGVHFADVPPGQAKYVTCPKGAILDVIVDIRVGSPTFGTYDTVLLDDVDRRAVYLSEGLGHAFCALEDGSTATYLCSTGYNPGAEHGINPLDPAHRQGRSPEVVADALFGTGQLPVPGPQNGRFSSEPLGGPVAHAAAHFDRHAQLAHDFGDEAGGVEG